MKTRNFEPSNCNSKIISFKKKRKTNCRKKKLNKTVVLLVPGIKITHTYTHTYIHTLINRFK